MPFITEELQQRLPHKDCESIVIATFPEVDSYKHFESAQSEIDINSIMNVIKTIRSIKSNLDYKNSKPDAYIQFNDDEIKSKFPCN